MLLFSLWNDIIMCLTLMQNLLNLRHNRAFYTRKIRHGLHKTRTDPFIRARLAWNVKCSYEWFASNKTAVCFGVSFRGLAVMVICRVHFLSSCLKNTAGEQEGKTTGDKLHSWACKQQKSHNCLVPRQLKTLYKLVWTAFLQRSSTCSCLDFFLSHAQAFLE